jgi:Carboxypeptidase regulatory-like domain
MRDNRLLRGACLCFILLASFVLAYGQSNTSLRGVITDPTGAVIPGAVVSLTNGATGFRRQSLSSEDGVYQFLQASPGNYQVTVEKAGFTTVTRDNVQLQVEHRRNKSLMTVSVTTMNEKFVPPV